jgi:hypothetical protein
VRVNPTQVRVNPTQVRVNPTQVRVNPTQVRVNPTPAVVAQSGRGVAPLGLAGLYAEVDRLVALLPDGFRRTAAAAAADADEGAAGAMCLLSAAQVGVFTPYSSSEIAA